MMLPPVTYSHIRDEAIAGVCPTTLIAIVPHEFSCLRDDISCSFFIVSQMHFKIISFVTPDTHHPTQEQLAGAAVIYFRLMTC